MNRKGNTPARPYGALQVALAILVVQLVAQPGLGDTPAGGTLLHAPLVRELIVTGEAQRKLQQEYRLLVREGALTSGQQREFSRYLQELAGRIADQCRVVQQRYPTLDPARLPCAGTRPLHLLPPEPADEQTVDEQVAALDATLMQGLGEFDEMLLTEQQKIASRAPRSGGDGGGMGSAGSGGGNGPARGAGAAGGAGSAAEGKTAEGETTGAEGTGKDGPASQEENAERGAGGSARGTGNGAGSTGASSPPVPDDIPDGRDDDVVARQLREAASKEQDPELRRKLWEEYRRYKAENR